MIVKPILFSTPMVQAILDGRKTQTRRIVKKQPINEGYNARLFKGHFNDLYLEYRNSKVIDGDVIKSRINKGDILWVRETWHKIHDSETDEFMYFGYKADWSAGITTHLKNKGIWNPSIHMPKSAARIFLEVTNVRCERLNDISKEDAIAEGIEFHFYEIDTDTPRYRDYMSKYDFQTISAIHSFASLWRSINGKDSWEANHWVWVYEFKVVDKPKNWPS